MPLSLHTNDGKTIKLISIFSKIIYWLPVVKWADQWQMQKHNQNRKRVYFIGNKKLNTDAKKCYHFCVYMVFSFILTSRCTYSTLFLSIPRLLCVGHCSKHFLAISWLIKLFWKCDERGVSAAYGKNCFWFDILLEN